VAGNSTGPPAERDGVRDLLPLATSRPRDGLTRAQAVLASQPGPFAASVAHQAIGIVLRDFGDVQAAISEFRRALRLARQLGSAEREADVLASLGVALVFAGRSRTGLAAFDQALQRSTGVLTSQVLHRRSNALMALGRYGPALEDARRAVVGLRRNGDLVWTARAITARGLINHAMGYTVRADADFAEAEQLFAKTNQELDSAYSVHNRALVAFSLNDIPAALSRFSEAASRYEALEILVPDLAVDRCLTLLAAGLASDALAEADSVVLDLQQMHGQATKRAELLLIAADSALAVAQPQAAIDRAQVADQLFRSQRSTWYLARTRLVLLRARYQTETASVPLLREAGRAAAQLERVRSGDAPQAHLLAGRLALELGRAGEADRHLAAAARDLRRGPAVSRANGWLGVALRAQAAGQTRHLLAACRRGLEVLDEYRFTLGASELRAQATAHGAELAVLAQRHAVGAGRPRLLLAWSERWRATTSAVPAVRPSADLELNRRLAAFRQVTSQVTEARRQDKPITRLHRDQRRLEQVVRAYALQAPGRSVRPVSAIDIEALLDQLGSTRLAEIVHVDGVIYVLVCGAGKVRQFAVGRLADATQAAGFARFALRRLAHPHSADDLKSALAVLAATAPKLQDALLGPAVRHLGDDEVVIVPPGRLHAIPWALLPALAGRAVSVTPSARAWLRARSIPPPSHRQVTLVRGPGLRTADAEVPRIAPLYDDPTVLVGAAATAQRVLRALEGTWLAHIAAHGTFRADSPLFSSLRMADGPLTVYDFEQLTRAPYRLVLPSCDSAVQAQVGADELLGLVSSLLPLGTAGIIAAVVQVNDEAAVSVMTSLHGHLYRGHSLAAAMYRVRNELADDPVHWAAATSFITLGAA
jgi:CHAT domain-containing protein/tetratricopeptide (TPR) repeat protein